MTCSPPAVVLGITWYTVSYNPRAARTAAPRRRSRGGGSSPAAEVAGQLANRLERLNRLQALRRRPAIGCIEAEARAVLEFDIELGRGQRHFRIAFGDVHLPLEHAAIAQAKFHVHRPAA